MLKQFISKKYIVTYFFFIVLTWLETVINPTLVKMIVSSFEGKNIHTLWNALTFGIIGN